MSDPAPDVGRPMKFPYTHSAKFAQFPFKLHYEKAWSFRYFIFGVIVSLPVFYKIHKLSNSPGNYEAMRKKKMEDEAHHH